MCATSVLKMQWHKMYFTLLAIIIFGNFPLFLMKQTSENHQIVDDTPSPEWIKYQQERYDPKYNKQTTSLKGGSFKYHPANKGATNQASGGQQRHKMPTQNAQHKLDSTPRENGISNQKQTEELEDLYVEDDNQDGRHQHSVDGDSGETKTNSIKYPSIPGFIEFLKSLKKSWGNKSLFRVDDKLTFLYNLRDTLMRAIEQNFMTLWPESVDNESEEIPNREAEDRHLRPKRGILDASNIDFPPEAALISINFLTFAVFLIKLVLQVVNIIKTKHVQFSSLGINTNSFTKG